MNKLPKVLISIILDYIHINAIIELYDIIADAEIQSCIIKSFKKRIEKSIICFHVKATNVDQQDDDSYTTFTSDQLPFTWKLYSQRIKELEITYHNTCEINCDGFENDDYNDGFEGELLKLHNKSDLLDYDIFIDLLDDSGDDEEYLTIDSIKFTKMLIDKVMDKIGREQAKVFFYKHFVYYAHPKLIFSILRLNNGKICDNVSSVFKYIEPTLQDVNKLNHFIKIIDEIYNVWMQLELYVQKRLNFKCKMLDDITLLHEQIKQGKIDQAKDRLSKLKDAFENRRETHLYKPLVGLKIQRYSFPLNAYISADKTWMNIDRVIKVAKYMSFLFSHTSYAYPSFYYKTKNDNDEKHCKIKALDRIIHPKKKDKHMSKAIIEAAKILLEKVQNGADLYPELEGLCEKCNILNSKCLCDICLKCDGKFTNEYVCNCGDELSYYSPEKALKKLLTR